MTRVEALRILGLEPDATPAEVKSAYRELVKTVHPDKNSSPNARHLFQLVQEAYETISIVEQQEHAREARDRAEREAKVRAARERAERETRQREKRARAEKEARERADRERRATEAREKEAQEGWERQRAAAATGIPGSICRFYTITVFIVTFIVALMFTGLIVQAYIWLWSIIDKIYPIKWFGFVILIFGGFPIFFIICFIVVGVSFIMSWVESAIDKRVREYQLRKFDKNNPPPSEDTTRGYNR